MKQDRKNVILDAGQALLVEAGGAQLTMRKIADRAGLSLGNLQYHYATRDVLLEALLVRFLDDFSEIPATHSRLRSGHLAQDIQAVLVAALTAPEYRACIPVFREMWAASIHQEDLAAALRGYYRQLAMRYGDMLQDLAGPATESARIHQAVSFLLPAMEGYCITGSALSVPVEQVAENWARILAGFLGGPSDC